MKIALFAREIEKVWRERLCLIIQTLRERGAELCYYKPFYDKALIRYKLDLPPAPSYNGYEDLPQDTALLVCFGGDGTYLESLTHVRERNIPIAGVNFGRLGFLTGAGMNDLSWIDNLISGKFTVEKRSLLKISSPGLPDDFFRYALNEITVQRKDPSMLGVKVSIDGVRLPSNWSDGLVISTPTGSTAYSLSIGGPIILPGAKVLIVAPIAPHNLNVRPLVIPESVSIQVSISSRWKEVILSTDNRFISVSAKELFTITKAEYDLNYVIFSTGGFIGALKEKLRWGDDTRNSSPDEITGV
ncbi:MAG: NAD(+)/NADH kinase [Bacteroidales bacterium]|nr:NAD(+)/NADH kinase [Bacteroidales bacterium]